MQTYTRGGVGSGTRKKINRVRLVQVLTRQKTGEKMSEIIRPYAATMIQRHSRRHQNWLDYGQEIGEFFNYLLRFKYVVMNPNINQAIKNQLKDNLIQSIPVGRTIERFLNKPGLAHNITELRTTLNNNFTFPQRNTGEYNHLIWLLNETQVMIDKEIHKRVNFPLLPQRTVRARSSPTTVLDLAQGRRLNTRRKRKNKGKQ